MKINETHICILKKGDNQLLTVDFLNLQYEFEEAFAELKRMSENENRTVCELETFIQNSPLEPLLEYFNFCKVLNSSYEGIYKYEKTEYADYITKVSKSKKDIDLETNSFAKNRLKEDLNEFIKSSREDVLKNLEIRKIAYMLNKEYSKCSTDTKILAYSHRKVGFTFPEFKLGVDFDVIYKSNFGYGNSSYFFTNIRYKGIDILPYSDWIRYAIVDKSEIIRYTRRHALSNASWLETMNFTTEVYNHSITNPALFVEKWIMNECREMVEGLEYLLNKDKDYQLIYSFFQPTTYTLIGYDLISLKGERISGALSFLDKISELKGISNSVDGFVKRILSCNLRIYSQLISEIKALASEIEILKVEINKIQPEWNALNSSIKEYQVKKNIIKNDVQLEKPDLNYIDREKEIEHLFKVKFPEFDKIKEDYEPVNSAYQDLIAKLTSKQNLKTKFEGYNKIIKDHFNASENDMEKMRVA